LVVDDLNRRAPQLVGVRSSEAASGTITCGHSLQRYEEGLVGVQAGVEEFSNLISQLALHESDIRSDLAMRQDIGPPSIDSRLESL